MAGIDPDAGPTPPRQPPVLRVVDPQTHGATLTRAVDVADDRARSLVERIERVQADLRLVRDTLEPTSVSRRSLQLSEQAVRYSVAGVLAALLVLAVWARHGDYALRVTSDTPTFLALVTDMAQRPFAEQSPFLVADVATQHATLYMQALAYGWRFVDGSTNSPTALGGYLALAGIVVFAFTLCCVFFYVRRLAGSLAAWIAIPVLLGIFGPPHVIWASDLSLHTALYAGFFPQNVAIGIALLALLALERRSIPSLVLACVLAALTMLVHPFTGVLLSVLATTMSCRRAVRRDEDAVRGPIALGVGFAAGMMWPAYSLDRAFAETGVRGYLFIALCVVAPLAAFLLGSAIRARPWSGLSRLGRWLAAADTEYRLALVGAVGTVMIAVWELALVRSPPEQSGRLAIYWVDDLWRWPLLLVAGTVGVSGLARLAQRGQIVPAVWFAGCFGLGTLGALGLPLPVWYRFLLLCQIPLAVGVATVVAHARRPSTTAIVAATFALALGVKVLTLVATPPTVSYLDQPLQPVWSLGRHIPPGPGLVATDPSTAYFIPATTGHRVLTVDKGHVSSRRELAVAREGYDLLHRYYAGGSDWWQAGREMWRRGVRYVVVAKQTTLEPATLDDFIWRSARLETPAQRRALGNYFYENNRVGTVLYDSPDFVVYRLDRAKLFAAGGGSS
jgi:hypothetical protein